ncbi:MAG: hypothetical protein JSW07_07810 [bacterium]|nr:MAG: hypothetical protein JSW07_07810 [bacterium]
MEKKTSTPVAPVETQAILGSIITVGGLIIASKVISNQIKGIIDEVGDQVRDILRQIDGQIQSLIRDLEKTYQNNLNITLNSLDRAV